MLSFQSLFFAQSHLFSLCSLQVEHATISLLVCIFNAIDRIVSLLLFSRFHSAKLVFWIYLRNFLFFSWINQLHMIDHFMNWSLLFLTNLLTLFFLLEVTLSGHSLILYLFILDACIRNNLLKSSNYLSLVIKVFLLIHCSYLSSPIILTGILAFWLFCLFRNLILYLQIAAFVLFYIA